MKNKIIILSLLLLLAALFVANIFWGSVHIDAADVIKALTHPGCHDNVAFIITG